MTHNPFFVSKVDQTPSGAKVSVSNFPDAAWDFILGGPEGNDQLWRNVAWLRRGIEVIAQACADTPFEFARGEDVITDSGNYEDPTRGLLSNPSELFALIASGLTLHGAAYLHIQKNRVRPMALRWMAASTIKPIIKSDGLQYFERRVNQQTMRLEVDEVLHFWLPDPEVEIGPPKSSPVASALVAAGALKSVDDYVTTFFERGAIKATILQMTGNPVQAEREKMKRWWSRLFRGSKTAWEEGIINAEKLNPIVIGEGLESLDNDALTNRLREDIATGLGIPQSILFSNATSYATAEQDFRQLYTLTIAPMVERMAHTFNEQLFDGMNLKLRFNMNAMDIFQEDEEDRSGAFLNLLNGMVAAPPKAVIVAMQMMGMELPGGMEWDELERLLSNEQREMPAPQLGVDTDLKPEADTVPEEEDDPEAKALSPLAVDLDKWRRKALKRMKRGEPAAVEFDSEHIGVMEKSLILELLEDCETPEEVNEVFNVTV